MVHAVLTDPSRVPTGSLARMVKAMIASVDQNPAPRRLVLGSDAFGAMHRALTERLVELEAQRNSAAEVDGTPE